MKKFEILVAVVLSVSAVVIAAEIEERTIRTDGEKITISVPKEWPAINTHQTPAGKPYYQLGPANTNYSIQFYLSEPVSRGTNGKMERLERALEAGLKPL